MNDIEKNLSLTRRHFIGMAAMGAGVPLLPDFTFASNSGKHNNKSFLQFKEPPKDIPIRGDFDVIVCGGGPAGVAAAISAARSGARTKLIELGGCLGGVWTSGLLTFILILINPD